MTSRGAARRQAQLDQDREKLFFLPHGRRRLPASVSRSSRPLSISFCRRRSCDISRRRAAIRKNTTRRPGARRSWIHGADGAALEWSDVDWTSGMLTIRGTLFQGQKGLPKNGRFQHFTMTPPLRACLESVYLLRQVERTDPRGSSRAGSSVARRVHRSTGTISGAAGGSHSLKRQSSRRSVYTISAGRSCRCSSMKDSRPGKSRAISGIGRS